MCYPCGYGARPSIDCQDTYRSSGDDAAAYEYAPAYDADGNL